MLPKQRAIVGSCGVVLALLKLEPREVVARVGVAGIKGEGMFVTAERGFPVAALLLRRAERCVDARVVWLCSYEPAIDRDRAGGIAAHAVERGEVVGGERVGRVAVEAWLHPGTLAEQS